ncbi:MAG: hypothetical protein WA510_21485 [Acidobacteriaceae bacterium]
MGSLTLFFDRNIGSTIPEAMRSLGLLYVYHHHLNPSACGEKSQPGHRGLFKPDEQDDVILRFCGERGWVVVSQDYKYHLQDNERDAIKQHSVGVFYLWGANAPRWETFRVLAIALPKLITTAENTPRPFIFKVEANSRLRRVSLETSGVPAT